MVTKVHTYSIMEAIANNDIELVRLFLEYHTNLNIKDNNGTFPLALGNRCKRSRRFILAMDETTKE